MKIKIFLFLSILAVRSINSINSLVNENITFLVQHYGMDMNNIKKYSDDISNCIVEGMKPFFGNYISSQDDLKEKFTAISQTKASDGTKLNPYKNSEFLKALKASLTNSKIKGEAFIEILKEQIYSALLVEETEKILKNKENFHNFNAELDKSNIKNKDFSQKNITDRVCLGLIEDIKKCANLDGESTGKEAIDSDIEKLSSRFGFLKAVLIVLVLIILAELILYLYLKYMK